MSNSPALSQFVKFYFQAEHRGTTTNGGFVKFERNDQILIVKSARALINKEYHTPYTLSLALASVDPRDNKFDRHKWRLNAWLGKFPETVQPAKVEPVAAKVQPKPSVVKPAAIGSAPVTAAIAEPNRDLLLLKQNLRSTIKSVTKSAIKNGLADSDIKSLVLGAVTEATEEYAVEQNELKFSAFLRQHNIDKNTALDILQRI